MQATYITVKEKQGNVTMLFISKFAKQPKHVKWLHHRCIQFRFL